MIIERIIGSVPVQVIVWAILAVLMRGNAGSLVQNLAQSEPQQV